LKEEEKRHGLFVRRDEKIGFKEGSSEWKERICAETE